MASSGRALVLGRVEADGSLWVDFRVFTGAPDDVAAVEVFTRPAGRSGPDADVGLHALRYQLVEAIKGGRAPDGAAPSTKVLLEIGDRWQKGGYDA